MLAVCTYLLRRRLAVQRTLAVAGALFLFGTAAAILVSVQTHGVIHLAVGAWAPPWGIAVAADAFSSMLLLGTSVVVFAVILYAMQDFGSPLRESGFYPLLFLVVAGVTGAFVATDLFNLFVWFELLLVASFGLMAIGSDKNQLEATLKYAGPSVVGSMLFLSGVGVLYGLTGTLNLADFSRRMPIEPRWGVVAGGILLLGGFGVKAAVFPLYFWLPASYHAPHGAVSALFAGLLTKVGVYAMIRVTSLLFPGELELFRPLFAVLAVLTLGVGVIGALMQQDIRRIFAFVLVATVGFMMIGAAVWTPESLAGTAFYMIEDMIAITALFLIADHLQRSAGTRTLSALRGKLGFRPILAVGFFLTAFSVASVPPLSGFWSKLVLARAGVASGDYVLVAAMMASGFVVLLTVARVWSVAFWSQQGVMVPKGRVALSVALPIGLLAAVPVAIGLYPEPILTLAMRAGAALADPQALIDAVLGP